MDAENIYSHLIDEVITIKKMHEDFETMRYSGAEVFQSE